MAALERFQTELMRPRGQAEKFAWSMLAIILPTALRWSLDRGTNAVPFMMYFPAIFFAGLFLGWRWSTLVIILSAMCAELLLVPGQSRHFGSAKLILLGFYLLSAALLVVSGEALRRSVIELKRISEAEHRLNTELNHRVSNILTVVQALAAQTFKHEPTETFVPVFSARLHALASANKIIANNQFHSCEITELVATALAPFKLGDNIEWRGPKVTIPFASCVPVVLALHELATNAVKYGSLSQDGGRVDVSWDILSNAAPGPTELRWQESGGPLVQKPTRKGLGSRLLKAQTGIKSILLAFEPLGVVCTIMIATI